MLGGLCTDVPLFSRSHSDKRRLGQLVKWIEKAGLENIRRLLEKTETESNHELLLTVKNLQELGGSPFPYIIPIIPRSLPAEVIEGEHFVLLDLLKLVPGSSSQAISTQEGQTEAATRTLVRYARATQPQSPQPAPQLAKKRETRVQQTKTIGAVMSA